MKRLFFFPNYKSNEYIDLLYSEADHWSVELIPWNRHLKMQKGDVFHVHWEDAVIKKSDNQMLSAEIFVGRMTEMKRLGVQIVWTVHNTQSHLSIDRAAESLIRDWLRDHADVICVHSTRHIELLQFAEIQSKICVIPLPIYIRAPLKKDLKRVTSVGTAGHTRDNKYLEEIITLLCELQRSRAVRGIIHSARYESHAPLPEGLELHNTYLDKPEFNALLDQMDVAVVLSASNLNSSALTNFLGRNIPCFIPRSLFFNTDLPDEYYDWVLPDDQAQWLTHMNKVLDDIERLNHVKSVIYQWSLARTPSIVSHRFFREVVFD